jgi:hypothetical protein
LNTGVEVRNWAFGIEESACRSKAFEGYAFQGFLREQTLPRLATGGRRGAG